MNLAFRPFQPSDTAFLYAAWIGSYEKSPWAGVLPQHAAYTIHKATIAQLFARGMAVSMAVNPDDHDQIIGFIAYEPGRLNESSLLHFVFVKDLFRRSGVAIQLLAFANFDRNNLLHTFRTADARYLGKRMVHKPGLARRKAAYP